ncbi:lantibiotic protection ABC transporter ATP-binding protein [Paenibacillus sp. HW567]|uniref:lantibiotic protection ABC transporter ATP-binding protein n=1 Tax=Paenibacillus sp. HW567 TaxID=1034769 RepID=UPI0003720AC8|nr:lantibiotic protection ABC transporter ATP-binding protein [Paenibacillus sp. HW567]
MESYLLETKQLSKRFKRQRAVENVSLSIPRGAIYGLLGPNGAGKTTTLKMITGLLRPSEGQILLGGKPWERRQLDRIGALIEAPALYGNLTARENLRVHAKLLKLPPQRIEEVLHTVDLKDTGSKRASQFSLGMKQRLGIAIALLNRPELLILDEPTNGLDPLGIQELRELIRSFPAQGITVILSSHILSEVEQIADHIGIISGGRLGYESKMHKGEDLEALFMQVVAQNREQAGVRHA